jgi:outer membrane autotransporter protein
LSGEKAFYEYSFAAEGQTLTMSIIPKSDLPGAITQLVAGSPSMSSMATSILEAVNSGVTFTGELESALLALINSQNVGEARAILSSLSGQVLAQGASLAQNTPSNYRASLNNFLGYEPVSTFSPGNNAPAAGDTPGSWIIEALFTGRWGEGDRVGDNPGFDVENYSGTIVAYHSFESLRVGASFSAGKTEVDFDNLAELDSEEITGALFVRYDSNSGWFLGLEGFLGQIKSESLRYTMGLAARANYTSDWFGFSLNAGKLFKPGAWRLTPRLGIAFTRINFPGFTESGAGALNQRSSGDRLNSMELEAGIYIARETSLGGLPFIPHLNLGIAYETRDTGLVLDTSFAHQSEVPSFISASSDSGRSRALVELGADLGISDNVNIFLDYRGSFRNHDRFHSATIGVKVNW